MQETNAQESIMASNGVLLCHLEKITDFETGVYRDAVIKLSQLCNQPHGNAFHQLNQFRKFVPILIRGYYHRIELLNAACEQLDRVVESSESNKHKRWSEDEENWLIDLVCKDTPILEISTILGRSASSIKTKVSTLVGIQRISQKVAGKFFGTINGENVEGLIEGTIHKNEQSRTK